MHDLFKGKQFIKKVPGTYQDQEQHFVEVEVYRDCYWFDLPHTRVRLLPWNQVDLMDDTEPSYQFSFPYDFVVREDGEVLQAQALLTAQVEESEIQAIKLQYGQFETDFHPWKMNENFKEMADAVFPGKHVESCSTCQWSARPKIHVCMFWYAQFKAGNTLPGQESAPPPEYGTNIWDAKTPDQLIKGIEQMVHENDPEDQEKVRQVLVEGMSPWVRPNYWCPAYRSHEDQDS